MKLLRGLILILFLPNCKVTNADSTAKDFAGGADNFTCSELHKQFHYDYDRLAHLWPSFQNPESECNKLSLESYLKAPTDPEEEVIGGYSQAQRIDAIRRASLEKGFLRPLRHQAIPRGTSVEEIDPTEIWSIHRIPLPIIDADVENGDPTPSLNRMNANEEFLTSLLCTDLYGHAGHQCEQRCEITKRLLMDLARYRREFVNGYYWDGEKKNCTRVTDQEELLESGKKGKRVELGFAACRIPCRYGQGEICSRIDFGVDNPYGSLEQFGNDFTVVCRSEEDARNVAETFCRHHGLNATCKNQSHSLIDGKFAQGDASVSGVHNEIEKIGWTLVSESKANASISGLGKSIEVETGVKTTIKGRTGVSYQTKSDGFVKLAGLELGNVGLAYRCLGIAETVESEENQLTTESGFKLFISPLKGGFKTVVNKSFNIEKEYSSSSHSVSGAGMTKAMIGAECQRWVHEWRETILKEKIEKNPVLEGVFEGDFTKRDHVKWDIENQDYNITCYVRYGEKGFRDFKVMRVYSKILDGELHFSYMLDTPNGLFGSNKIYPGKKGWFRAPLIDKEILKHVNGIIGKKLSDVQLANFLLYARKYTLMEHATFSEFGNDEGKISSCSAYY
jgi:hypothetical protein